MILLDVNVWFAATWARHAQNQVAVRWFDQQADDLLLCRITQMGLLRLLSNPALMGDDALTRNHAWRVIDQLWSDDRVLWADEPDDLESVFRTLSARDDRSHKLWIDDYLAAFAQTSGAALATFDRQLGTRYPSVEVIEL